MPLSIALCTQRSQVAFGSTTLLALHGKGRKDTCVPLWPRTGRIIAAWFPGEWPGEWCLARGVVPVTYSEMRQAAVAMR
jgi:hypothetical protein